MWISDAFTRIAFWYMGFGLFVLFVLGEWRVNGTRWATSLARVTRQLFFRPFLPSVSLAAICRTRSSSARSRVSSS